MRPLPSHGSLRSRAHPRSCSVFARHCFPLASPSVPLLWDVFQGRTAGFPPGIRGALSDKRKTTNSLSFVLFAACFWCRSFHEDSTASSSPSSGVSREHKRLFQRCRWAGSRGGTSGMLGMMLQGSVTPKGGTPSRKSRNPDLQTCSWEGGRVFQNKKGNIYKFQRCVWTSEVRCRINNAPAVTALITVPQRTRSGSRSSWSKSI